MKLLKKVLTSSLIVWLASSSVAIAEQRHVVDRGALAAAVAGHAAEQEAARAAIRDALAHPQVRDVASKMGVDVDQISASLTTLSGPDLERAASAARQVNETLVGGATTVVISTTTIIIILLLVIILVVALK